MPPSFEIDTAETSGVVTLAVSGEIDLATAPLMDEQLVAAEAMDAPIVIVDLDQVSFMDSTGLQVLLAHALSATDGHRLRLTRGSAQVQRLFQISGVLDRLPFVSAAQDPALSDPGPDDPHQFQG